MHSTYINRYSLLIISMVYLIHPVYSAINFSLNGDQQRTQFAIKSLSNQQIKYFINIPIYPIL